MSNQAQRLLSVNICIDIYEFFSFSLIMLKNISSDHLIRFPWILPNTVDDMASLHCSVSHVDFAEFFTPVEVFPRWEDAQDEIQVCRIQQI